VVSLGALATNVGCMEGRETNSSKTTRVIVLTSYYFESNDIKYGGYNYTPSVRIKKYPITLLYSVRIR